MTSSSGSEPAHTGCPVAIVGGGPAGLATAACLKAAGIKAVVFESAPRLGQHWRGHYDRLRLHTGRTLSGLPGLPLPRSYGQWVARDDFAEYLDNYARHHRLEVRTGVTVAALRRGSGGGWRMDVGDTEIGAAHVVVATGFNRRPKSLDFPGLSDFAGRVCHSSQYRNKHEFDDGPVLVVGSGNSGAEIAVDLAERSARRVLLAVRTAPNILPRTVAGLPTQFLGVLVGFMPTRAGDLGSRVVQRLAIPDLTDHGLPRSPVGIASQFARGEVTPILDVGLVEAVRSGRIQVVPAVERFTRESVVFSDGSKANVSAVVAATGYERGLDELVGSLDVLDARQRPRASGGSTLPHAPGLHFIGYQPAIGGHLREIGREARRLASVIANEGHGRATRVRRPLPSRPLSARRRKPLAPRPTRSDGFAQQRSE